MDSITVTLNALLPIFAVMVLGYFARFRGHISEAEASKLNSVVMRYFITVKVFNELLKAKSANILHSKLVIFVSVFLVVLFTVLCVFVVLIEKQPSKRGSMLQAMYRTNYASMGLILISSIFRNQNIGMASLVLLPTVICNNALCAAALELFRNRSVSVGKLCRQVMSNPLVLSPILAVAIVKSGVMLPTCICDSLDIISNATSGLVLFFFGASFHFAMGTYRRELIICSVIRQIVIPAVGIGLATLFGFRGLELVVITCILIAPPSTTAYSVSQELGADAELSAQFIVLDSALSLFFIFFWLWLIISVGLVF